MLQTFMYGLFSCLIYLHPDTCKFKTRYLGKYANHEQMKNYIYTTVVAKHMGTSFKT